MTKSFFADLAAGSAVRYNLNPRRSRLKDALCNLHLSVRIAASALRHERVSTRKVLVVGVSVPGREEDMKGVLRKLVSKAHHVDVSVVEMHAGTGKFENVERAIASASKPLSQYDWLVITDDDIDVSSKALDLLIQFSEDASLTFSQPAHSFISHASLFVTQRQSSSLVRETRFVEIGPLTLINRRAFGKIIPFPPSRWCWGIDVYWSHLAKLNNWRMGVIDAVPMTHLKPPGGSYPVDEAVSEADALLRRLGVTEGREILSHSRMIL